MNEPSPRSSRLAIAGGLAALFAIGGGGFLIGRATTPTTSSPSVPAAAPSPVASTAPERPDNVLARGDLIQLGETAADATSSGLPMPKSVEDAIGQRFQLYLPFGCDGPSPEDSEAALRWRYDRSAGTLRVHVAPTSWALTDWWQTPPPGLEALEGFWVARPWSSRETCGGATATPTGIDPITLPGQTLGVAELVTSDTPRQLSRQGKPYESVVRMAPEALRVEAGLRLRLRGRIASFPQGQAVRCAQPGGREQRPVCIVAVSLDEVAIENPADQEMIAVWSPIVGNPPHSRP